MKYRVIQWATGGVGRAAIDGILSHPELELVGCWVHSPEKAGRDVGELAGIGVIGVRATNDVAELLALEADCVMYSPIMAKREEVIRILESGKNVVTPLNWFYPNKAKVARHPPGRHHRALPADGVGALAQRDARARGGVLRLPQLWRARGGRRDDAIRQDARAGREEPDARGDGRRLPAVDRHGRRRARLRARRQEDLEA
ncbi:MAG: hypothetical protein E6J87_04705 [Deltaproteobacteria bacterium]|nr:MAG: hypothetical protein E6J87_04705 [Deltaproteobacteria bacterium]